MAVAQDAAILSGRNVHSGLMASRPLLVSLSVALGGVPLALLSLSLGLPTPHSLTVLQPRSVL